MAIDKKNLKLAARICFVVAFLSTMRFYLGYFQTKYQLVSPLIPKTVIDQLTDPFLGIALISSVVILASALTLFKRKFVFSLIISATILIFHFLYLVLRELGVYP